MLPLKFHGDISTSFGKFDSLKFSLRNLKISKNPNFESRITDRKQYFHVHFDLYFQGMDYFVEIY